ncbi:MAG TPA: hypothetical protein VFU27_05145 [Terriglobales bacterium]|nr:hypothetical protein [Terriglobales bacterium]
MKIRILARPIRNHMLRGINSIGLVNNGARSWLVSAQWQNETEHLPTPGK